MTTELIKGICENCAFAFEGPIQVVDRVCSLIKCPNCHEPVSNFDSSLEVDALNKSEGTSLDYHRVEAFELVDA